MTPSELSSKLDTRFRGQRLVALGKLVSDLRRGAIIPKGTFVVMTSGDRKLRAKILQQEALHKGFSIPLPLNQTATDLKVTPHYLLWFFSHSFVGDHLLSHASGAVFLRVPKRILLELPVPIPKRATFAGKSNEVVLQREDLLTAQLSSLYDDYRLSVKHERYQTAVILAGAISEMLLFQSLIEQGVDRKLLEADRNLGIGKMLIYLELLKLNDAVPVNHFRDIQNKRNAAVHAGRLAGKAHEFSKSDLECFDHIIKHYGI